MLEFGPRIFAFRSNHSSNCVTTIARQLFFYSGVNQTTLTIGGSSTILVRIQMLLLRGQWLWLSW